MYDKSYGEGCWFKLSKNWEIKQKNFNINLIDFVKLEAVQKKFFYVR